MHVPCTAAITSAGLAVASALVATEANGPSRFQQLPQFRSGIELIAVDVQVIDRDGQPVLDLVARDFNVSIDGRRREVVSAQLFAHGTSLAGTGPGATEPPATSTLPSTAAITAGRIFVLAIDCLSFDPGVSRGVVDAARQFVKGLQPSDAVGVFAFPVGPKIDPTTDRAAVERVLDQVTGQRDPPLSGGVSLGASEMVDYLVDAAARQRIDIRVCGGVTAPSGAITTPPDINCVTSLQVNIQTQLAFLEGNLRTSLDMLGQLFDALASVPTRKTVVLVSAGMPVSDRPGGRPDAGTLPVQIGERAARSNSTLYTLFIDRTVLERFSAEQRRPITSPSGRDSQVAMRWLDQFSGTAGGALMHVLVGSGESSLRRIIRETSAYYLVGVASLASDRDGRAHDIKVEVGRRGATVRSRKWLIIPRAGS